MALRETLDKWNKVVPVTMTERKLLAPTEEFVMNALINIFNKIDLSVPQNIKCGDEDLRRKSKLKLCQKVDELYKLSEKKNGFFYVDLIEPTPKRTLQLLQNLLNYVLYYDMVKEEMMGKCEESIKHLESLKTRKCGLEVIIADMLIKENNRLQQEKDHIANIKQTDAKVIEGKAKLSQIDDDWLKSQEKLKHFEEDSLAIQTKINRMQDGLLPKTDLDSLKKEIESVQSSKEELNAIISFGKVNNDTIYKENEQIREQITILETLVKEAKSVESVTNPKTNGLNTSAQEIKELLKKLSTMKTEVESMKMKEKASREKIVAKKEEMKNLIAKFNEYEKSQQRELDMLIKENTNKKEKVLEPMKLELEKMQTENQHGIAYISEILSIMDISDLI